jgi:hypothetical protein
MSTEQEFETQLSRLRKLRDNVGKNIKDHKEKIAINEAILATTKDKLKNSKNSYYELQEQISELWQEHDTNMIGYRD